MLPKINLGYYVPVLPYVHSAMSVDFGSGNRSSHPDSIHGCRIDAAVFPENDPNQQPQRVLSYISRNGTNNNEWKRDDEDYDVGIELGEAYSIWQKLGYGIVCTGSLKEAQFLNNVCGIKDVIFVDEMYLQFCVDHLGYQRDVWTSASGNFPVGTDLVDTCTNSFYKTLRISKLIAQYQQIYYEHYTEEEMEINKSDFHRLKNLKSLFL